MRIDCLETPALLVDRDALDRNMERMRLILEKSGVALRPHYKSHKSTAIAHLQIQAGAKGICCAKVSEAEDLAMAGVEDILVANQVVEKSRIARLAWLAKGCRIAVCVDQAQNIRDLEQAAAFADSRIHCLVEYEVGMGRCGVETPEAFADLARRSGLEDIESFASVYATIEGKSSRADEIIRETQSVIADKMEIEMEIDTLMSAAKSEVNIMLFMPLVILLVIGYAGAGFMDAIYTEPIGRLVATGGLIVFIISFALARKFSNVKI